MFEGFGDCCVRRVLDCEDPHDGHGVIGGCARGSVQTPNTKQTKTSIIRTIHSRYDGVLSFIWSRVCGHHPSSVFGLHQLLMEISVTLPAQVVANCVSMSFSVGQVAYSRIIRSFFEQL